MSRMLAIERIVRCGITVCARVEVRNVLTCDTYEVIEVRERDYHRIVKDAVQWNDRQVKDITLKYDKDSVYVNTKTQIIRL